MGILTKEYLKSEYLKMSPEKRALYNNIKFTAKNKYDVFISHSYMDKELINVLYEMFNKCGYNVFIDWKNEELQDRGKVNEIVALKLKLYMQNSDGLLYISTDNSSQSKWCPWELGYVDGLKNRVAILPILDSVKKFEGQEYLGIYPYITYDKYANKDCYDFWVNDVNNPKKYASLRSWLKDGKLTVHN